MKRQAGFTLIEMLIAISLVAVISAGLLTTMRNGLLTMQKTQQRLGENRRALGIQDFISRQIGGAMPVKGRCGAGDVFSTRELFRGTDTAMLLVSNESMEEGSRGRPRIALYQVRENRDGTVRLEVTEQPFVSPISAAPFCGLDLADIHSPANANPPFVLLDHLAYCRFVYRNLNLETLFGREMMDAWVRPYLPHSIRIELAPAANSDVRMPVGGITIPLRIGRDPGMDYFDE
ncbi:MAG: prepilin-type N-terminal cleavage/methylation domain-containing protein [Bryobacteraceae bacterium]